MSLGPRQQGPKPLATSIQPAKRQTQGSHTGRTEGQRAWFLPSIRLAPSLFTFYSTRSYIHTHTHIYMHNVYIYNFIHLYFLIYLYIMYVQTCYLILITV